MHDCRPHIVVPMRRAVAMVVFFEQDRINCPVRENVCRERMRLDLLPEIALALR
jgi:hypothetical protein